MSLKERITEDMKAAMRAKDSERLGTIRMLTAAIKQREVDERIQLDDTQVLAVLEKMIKQRKESVAQFTSGGRDDFPWGSVWRSDCANTLDLQLGEPTPVGTFESGRTTHMRPGRSGEPSHWNLLTSNLMPGFPIMKLAGILWLNVTMELPSFGAALNE